MREFRAYEYVDGDIKVYVREEGQVNETWQELALIKYTWPRTPELSARALAERLQLELTENEEQQLGHELAWPRRW